MQKCLKNINKLLTIPNKKCLLFYLDLPGKEWKLTHQSSKLWTWCEEYKGWGESI